MLVREEQSTEALPAPWVTSVPPIRKGVDVCHLSAKQRCLSHRMYMKEAVGAAEQGYRVAVVAPPGGGRPDPRSLPIDLLAVRPTSSFLRWMTAFRAARRSRGLGAKVLHVHDLETLLAAVLLRRRGSRLVYDSHEDFPMVYAHNLHARGVPAFIVGSIERTLYLLERMLARRADHVLAVDPYIAEKFRRWAVPVTVLRNAAWRRDASPGRDNGRLLAEVADRYRGRKVFIYVGAISRQVAAVECAEAVARVRKNHPEVKVVFLGGFEAASDRTAVEAAIRDRGLTDHFEVIEEVPYEEVFPYLSVATVGLIVYSVHNNYGDRCMYVHKLFDYLRAGLPMLISDFGGLREVTEPHRVALYARPSDVDQIEAAMRRFLESPRETRQMAGASTRWFAAEMNWEKEQVVLLQVYERLVAGAAAQ